MKNKKIDWLEVFKNFFAGVVLIILIAVLSVLLVMYVNNLMDDNQKILNPVMPVSELPENLED